MCILKRRNALTGVIWHAVPERHQQMQEDNVRSYSFLELWQYGPKKTQQTIRTQCVKTLSVIFYGYFILYSMYNGNSTEHRIDLTINPNIECNVCKTAIQINFDQTVSWVLHQWWLFLLLLVRVYMILCIVFFIIIFYQSYIHNGLLF